MEAASLPTSLGMCIKSHLGLWRGGTRVLYGAMICGPSCRSREKQLSFPASPPGGKIIPGKSFLLGRGSLCLGLYPEVSPSGSSPHPCHLTPWSVVQAFWLSFPCIEILTLPLNIWEAFSRFPSSFLFPHHNKRIRLCVHPFVYVSIHPSVHLSLHPFTYSLA